MYIRLCIRDVSCTKWFTKSNVDVRAMDDVPFVLDAFVKGRFVESYNKEGTGGNAK